MAECSDEAHAKPWTRAMTGFLVRMRRRGKTYGWIAKALGLTRGACVARAVKLGLLLKPVMRGHVTLARRAHEPAPLGARRDVLGEGVCHWISGDPWDSDWRMCGHPCVHGTSWCAHHLARVSAVGNAPPPENILQAKARQVA
jgi:hypothetical protein